MKLSEFLLQNGYTRTRRGAIRTIIAGFVKVNDKIVWTDIELDESSPCEITLHKSVAKTAELASNPADVVFHKTDQGYIIEDEHGIHFVEFGHDDCPTRNPVMSTSGPHGKCCMCGKL